MFRSWNESELKIRMGEIEENVNHLNCEGIQSFLLESMFFFK